MILHTAGKLHWANINTLLYNTLFMGQERTTPKCMHSLSKEHSTEQCRLVNGSFFQMMQSVPTVQTAAYNYPLPATSTYPTPWQQQRQHTTKPQICGLYTMQVVIHTAHFTIVILSMSAWNVFRTTQGCTASHTSSCSNQARYRFARDTAAWRRYGNNCLSRDVSLGFVIVR